LPFLLLFPPLFAITNSLGIAGFATARECPTTV
jgi:hypothetical protein